MIKIVTDTAASLPAEIIEQYGITQIPLYVIFGEEPLREFVDIDGPRFFERLAHSPVVPTTSQPSVGEFEEVYRRLLNENPAATILSIHITSTGSGTVETAQLAARSFPGAKIHIFDTLAFSICQGLMVRQAAEMAKLGASIQAILDRLSDMRNRIEVYFVLDTLDYVAKAGRISKIAHRLGTLLNIKPILTYRNGEFGVHSRPRTLKHAYAALRQIALEAASGKSGIHLAIGHALRLDDARRLADDLRAVLDVGVFFLSEVGPTLGVNTGPGALGVCWYAP